MRSTPLSAILLATCAALSAADGAPEPTQQRSLYDLLGGATWSQRRGEIILGWSSLDVDGIDANQSAYYLSAAASAISGYRAGADKPFGGILGLGASVKTWWGNDDVDVRAIAPFAYGIAGGYADFSERTRVSLTGRLGPGLGWVEVGSDSDLGLAWNWAVEGDLTLVEGESAGLGIGVGYEAVHVEDFTQEGPYVVLTIGF